MSKLSLKEIEAAKKKRKQEEVTRYIAFAIAFISVFIFFIKLLFL